MIAFAGVMLRAGFDPRKHLQVTAIDNDPTAAYMCFINTAGDDATDLAVEDVGRLAAQSFGRKTNYSPGAIRKWIRSGLRSVRLPAYPSGSGYRVRPRDFERFVAEVRGQKLSRPPRDEHVAAGTVQDEDDLEAELRAGQQAYAASVR